jgi:hypothetical protein
MAAKPVDKWTSRTVVWVADSDPYSTDYREAYDYEIEGIKNNPYPSMYGGKNIYDLTYAVCGTDLKAVLREKIKVCRVAIAVAKDNILYAIENIQEEIKNL